MCLFNMKLQPAISQSWLAQQLETVSTDAADKKKKKKKLSVKTQFVVLQENIIYVKQFLGQASLFSLNGFQKLFL